MLVTAISVAFCLITSILAAPIPQPLAENSVKLTPHWRARAPVAEPENDWRREAEAQPGVDWRREAEAQRGGVDWRREADAQPGVDWRREAKAQPGGVDWRREAEAIPEAQKSDWRARKVQGEVLERASNELAGREPQYNYPPHWRTGP